ncbi:YcnI family protein [Patulibacter sp.]|uniref:YcnI family copper-binding membrane protein n=1 Tax=Patulibacter sp. TaxID=1912859 RepID=UPI002722B2C7|nr:YcnI family protein [Patulibacter sp.]MDO9406915.1 YcnI family protein [Patulibacter sp.]
MNRTTTVALAATTLALAAAAPASAHVTIQPDEAPAGSYAVVDVRVPNEKDDAGTLKVELQLPPGVSYAAYQPVPNWTTTVTKRKPSKPFSVEGTPVTSEVDTITWTGRGRSGVVAPGQFLQFPVSLRIPDGAEGSKIQFKALQTYEGGEVVRWIGAADSELPAPTVTLDEPEPEHGGHQAATSGTSAAATTAAATADDADDESDDDGGDALPIVLGAAGLIAGLAGLGLAVAGRRRTS